MIKNRHSCPPPHWFRQWLVDLAMPSMPQLRSHKLHAMNRKRDKSSNKLSTPSCLLSFSSLPHDILLNVFAYLSTQDLQQAARVCHIWSAPAHALLDRRRRHIRSLASCTLSQVIRIDGLSPVEHREDLQYFEKILCARHDTSQPKPTSLRWRFGCR